MEQRLTQSLELCRERGNGAGPGVRQEGGGMEQCLELGMKGRQGTRTQQGLELWKEKEHGAWTQQDLELRREALICLSLIKIN